MSQNEKAAEIKEKNDEKQSCKFCHGEGYIILAGHVKKCPVCNGTGYR